MSTPHERVQAYLDTVPEGAKWASVLEPARPLIRADLKSVLDANKGYEALMRDAAREAVQEYKRELAKELRERIRRGWNEYTAEVLDDLADDLEDGTL